MLVIIQECLYPLMCYTDENEDLFENDNGICSTTNSCGRLIWPGLQGRQLLCLVFGLRHEQMFEQSMQFCMQVLENVTLPPRQKDGIFHILGTMGYALFIKNDLYKDQVEAILVSYVFPEFLSQHSFLRERACWVLKFFARIPFMAPENMLKFCNHVSQCILNDTSDTDMPVKLEVGC